MSSRSISEILSSITIKLSENYPRHKIHLYADYVELISLFSKETIITYNDILDRFKDEGVITQKAYDSEQSQENDENESFTKSIFQLLNYRSFLYNGFYPFSVIKEKSILLNNSLDNTQKLYLSLLISSNLSIFTELASVLTTEFEVLSYQILKDYLPEHAKVILTGKKSPITGNAIERITEIGKLVGLEVDTNHVSKRNFAGNKERGLDVIGWIPFIDPNSNLMVFLCQCACGLDWPSKSTEANRYRKYFVFDSVPPVCTMFIPYSLVDFKTSHFYQSDEMFDSLFFERGRIITYLKDSNFYQTLESSIIVDKCLEVQEGIV